MTVSVELLAAWMRPRLPTRWPATVCNIGIGAGSWDDWLGHELGVSITSIDRDPQICRAFAARQRYELHPYPSIVRCGDVCDGLLRPAHRLARGSSPAMLDQPRFAPRYDEGFDAITIVTCPLTPELEHAARAALAPGGMLLVYPL